LTKINNEKKSINIRQSRQDEYYQAINNRETMKSTRSLSRVRFRLSTITQKREMTSQSTTVLQAKSILKKSPIQRTSSDDRD
ncbi:unnamed protein product, partial [Rotaria sp. Silwood1]